MVRLAASLALVLAVVPAASSCGGESRAAPTEITGVIVAVEGEGSRVTAFRVDSGLEEYEVRIAADRDYGFDLAHLREHERTREPVRCQLEERSDGLYAVTIEDAEPEAQ